jgi:hypothetical protein
LEIKKPAIEKSETISSTELLDHEEKNKSFQNVHLTYKKLVRSVLSETKSSQMIFQ